MTFLRAQYMLIICILFQKIIGTTIAGIKSVRFASGTNIYEEGRDGVLEVNYNGTWGTVCNFGFDELAASVACFMMGLTPRGVAILNSPRRSDSQMILSNFNCTGRLVLPSSSLSTATVHLGVCSFTDEIPEGCQDGSRQTSIICLDAFTKMTTTTPVPNYMTVAPVDCSRPSSSIIRLVGGTDREGLVQIQHPETGEWGTICADGVDIYAARTLCRMLCTSADNLKYAQPVLYKHQEVDETVPIHLSGIRCPEHATDLNQCTLGGGWGATRWCTHAMDVGLQCAPPQIITPSISYAPQLSCTRTDARVTYDKQVNPDLNTSMITLVGQVPVGCQFRVVDNGSHIQAIIPLEGCGGSLSLQTRKFGSKSNESDIAIKFELLRDFVAPSTGIISNLPVRFSVTCLIPRINRIPSEVIASPQVITDLVGATQAVAASLKLYQDPGYSISVRQGQSIRPGQSVYVKVSLVDPKPASKLILQDCWATINPERQSTPRQNLIINRCIAYDGLTVHPINLTEVGFSFPAFYLGTAGHTVPASASLYLHCDTRICHASETSTFCQQFCTTPTKLLRRRRRGVFALPEQTGAKYINFQEGQVHVR
ncbi:hypothetical protein CRM22_002507 [Opisthorchis felineus]|uniref:SRCR domain-containing protein n=1 Tax=Opisthorchis felineus TaxID=147828 RepID=A0A4S2M5W8_OPIFE|nr:hypothetical protein CRM22_002507 [Opisthorchis felineus]